MAKKIYDIKPPKLAVKAEKEIRDFFEGGAKKRVTRSSAKKNTSEKSVRRKEKKSFVPAIIIGGVAVVAVLALILFFKLPRADVIIWPKTDILSFSEKISGDKTESSVKMDDKIIPVQYLEEEKDGSEDFPATGSASDDGKATGTIRVYNKYNPPSPITLKSGTHFLSDSGKYFVTLQKIVIPAGKKSGGKVTPSYIDVKVEAAESGPSFNIKPAKFSVPKLAGTTYYYSIYAESTDDMSGGYTGKIKKVTDDDIQAAKDSLTKKLISDAENSLKGNISSDYVLLDGAISSETESSSASVKAGTISDSFTYEAKVVARALVAKKSDIDKFAKDYIASHMPDSKIMLDQSYTIDYSPESIDIQGGKMVLNINFSSKIYSSIDKNSLSNSFKGMTADQINKYINDSLGENILKSKVNLWPFWVAKAPNSQKAVRIDLRFE